MNNQYLKLGLAALMAGIYSTGVSADVADGEATANVVAPIVLTVGAQMDFGDVAVDTGGGTVVLDTAGSRVSVTGDAVAVGGAAGGTAGGFTIQGVNTLTFDMTFTNGTLTDAAGVNPMTVGAFTDTRPATLNGAVQAFTVGATLTIPGSQPAGGYSTLNPSGAAYTVTANYN